MNSKRFSSALEWCVSEYKDDLRKSSGSPSVHHPLGVCDLVMGAGGDEDTSIASLFHDFAEDKGGEEMLARIARDYGDRVARIVRDCSDTIPSDYTMKESWVDRKVAHIRHIQNFESDSCLVLTADTLHNARDHVRGVRTYGDEWWSNFRANVYLDKEITKDICAASTLWYLENKAGALLNRTIISDVNTHNTLSIQDVESFDGSIVGELIEVVRILEDLLTKEQWNMFLDVSVYMKMNYNIG